MPGLNQSFKISNNRLKIIWKFLIMNQGAIPLRYGNTPHVKLSSPSWWLFFGVNYTNREDEEYLRNALQILCSGTTYCTVSKHLELTVKWDYIHIKVDLFIPNYIPEELHKF